MIKDVLTDSWLVYRSRFGVIAAVVIAIWLPCNLLSNYCDAFVFGPEDFRRSFRFSQFLDSFVGIIATAGVISVASAARSDQTITFGGALGSGFGAWGRMWWTRLLAGILILFAFLLLILPGIYVLVCLCFVESIAVDERISGTHAIARSFELTKGRFWQTFRFCCVVGLLVLVPVLLVILPASLIPALDHWLIDTAVQLAVDLVTAFVTVAFFCGYEAYAKTVGSAL